MRENRMRQHSVMRWAACVAGGALMLAGLLPGIATALQSDKDNRAETQERMADMPRLQEKRIITATGQEDWKALSGFGTDAGMAQMMTLMMVGGSRMEHMRMGAMKPGMKMRGMAPGTSPDRPQGLSAAMTLSPRPPIIGDNALDVAVTDAAGRPVTGLKFKAQVAMTSMDMGTTRPKVTEGKQGHYSVTASFSMAGPWRVTLTATPPHSKPFTQSFDLDVPQ